MAVGARCGISSTAWQAEDWVVVPGLDDLEWADRPSLRAVLFALRRLRADKVLIAVRPGAVLVDAGWAGSSAATRGLCGFAWRSEVGDLTQPAAALGSGSCHIGSVPAGNLGSVQRQLGDLDAARATQERTLAIKEAARLLDAPG